MKRRHFYITLMAMSVMFMAFPTTVIYPFWPLFPGTPIQLNVYAWIHLVHLQLVAQIALNVYDSQPDELRDNRLYLAFMVYDWADFTLTCNQEYSKIGPIPVTANVISLAGFVILSSFGQVKTRYFKL